MHMRAEGPYKPKHDREQCLELAKRKCLEAKRALGDVKNLVERPVDDSLFRVEAPMEVLVRLASRLRHHVPNPDSDTI